MEWRHAEFSRNVYACACLEEEIDHIGPSS